MKLAHAIAHIEFNAINLALDAAYRFRGMPHDFSVPDNTWGDGYFYVVYDYSYVLLGIEIMRHAPETIGCIQRQVDCIKFYMGDSVGKFHQALP